MGDTLSEKSGKIAVWAVTPNGAALSRKIADSLPDVEIILSARLEGEDPSIRRFPSLSESVSHLFHHYRGHVFIMATGIVIRSIASLIRHKTVDPAVVVVDEMGQYAISLLSGHIGGANSLAKEVAASIDAVPVITTATDGHHLPAIDVLATDAGLRIENPEAIKTVHMALLSGERITCYDPYGLICQQLDDRVLPVTDPFKEPGSEAPGIFIDDTVCDLPPQILILRPKSLVAGIGCNRNTPMAELKACLLTVFRRFGYSTGSLRSLATIDIKADEPGLLALAEDLGVLLEFYDGSQLERVEGIETPSSMVEKHVGVKSVCEAAVILAAGKGNLIVPKQTTPNVTVAIARSVSIS